MAILGRDPEGSPDVTVILKVRHVSFEMKALMDAHTHNDALFLFSSGDGGMDTEGKEEKGGATMAAWRKRWKWRTAAAAAALHFDLEGRTGNMVVAPFDQQDVVATFANQIIYLVLVPAGMLDEHLVAWSLRSVNANE